MRCIIVMNSEEMGNLWYCHHISMERLKNHEESVMRASNSAKIPLNSNVKLNHYTNLISHLSHTFPYRLQCILYIKTN